MKEGKNTRSPNIYDTIAPDGPVTEGTKAPTASVLAYFRRCEKDAFNLLKPSGPHVIVT